MYKITRMRYYILRPIAIYNIMIQIFTNIYFYNLIILKYYGNMYLKTSFKKSK